MISEKNKKIIACLRNNARMPLTKMSKKTHMPVSTIFDKLKQHENSLINKHTCLIDFSKLGYNTRANIIIKVKKSNKDAIKNYLMRHHLVNSLYRINNGYDFMIEGVFRQIRDMEEFLEEMDGKFSITKQSAYFIIDDLKRESFMSDIDLTNIT